MDLLQEFFLGNTLQNWLIALLTFILVFIALKIIQSMAVRKLSKLAATTDTQIDDLFVCMLRQTKFFILLVVSSYLASSLLYLNPSLVEVWKKVVVLALILQSGLWASAGISFTLGNIIGKHAEEDTALP